MQIYSHKYAGGAHKNILNSSTRVNTQPSSQTPKKTRPQYFKQPDHVLNYICRTRENITPSPHQRSTTMINIKQKENIVTEAKADESALLSS